MRQIYFLIKLSMCFVIAISIFMLIRKTETSMYLQRGNEIVAMIEKYKKTYKKYPVSLGDILSENKDLDSSARESFCPYYETNDLKGRGYCYYALQNHDNYSLIISGIIGNSMVFDTNSSRKWTIDNDIGLN